jgi:hypothetical protein
VDLHNPHKLVCTIALTNYGSRTHIHLISLK